MNWQLVYDDPVADEICKDTLINFLPYFADLQKQMHWCNDIAMRSFMRSIRRWMGRSAKCEVKCYS
ncbi:MAG: hypothetical protein CBD27_10270 [Rhodospirillaceae bacterium TMED167]|nr:hypothetical protein [Rhodospirillaceae bacterium]OUW24922.1 MAG: hypothetical protein CBD27_10270 [Rhodospirillaceae bacterium TMED167]